MPEETIVNYLPLSLSLSIFSSSCPRTGGNFLSSRVSTVYWKSWTEEESMKVRNLHQVRGCLVEAAQRSGRKFNLVSARISTDILFREALPLYPFLAFTVSL